MDEFEEVDLADLRGHRGEIVEMRQHGRPVSVKPTPSYAAPRSPTVSTPSVGFS